MGAVERSVLCPRATPPLRPAGRPALLPEADISFLLSSCTDPSALGEPDPAMADTLSLDPPTTDVARRLTAPAQELPLDELPSRWFQQAVEVTLRGLGHLAGDPALTGRIRGAWGRELMRAASPAALDGRPCTWSPPCALDVLFREQGRAAAGLPIPRPAVISARAHGRDLVVRLSLIGFACDWIDSAGEALIAALRHGDPLRLAGGSDPPATGPRGPGTPAVGAKGSAIAGRRLATWDGIAVPPAPALAELSFVTPLCLRQGGVPAFDGPRMLLSSLANRIAGLARWHDARIAADWRGLAEAADELHSDAAGLRSVRWTRRSDRQGRRLIPMTGLTGTLVLAGDLGPAAPLLALGALCHAGSHTALGLGAYDLTLM